MQPDYLIWCSVQETVIYTNGWGLTNWWVILTISKFLLKVDFRTNLGFEVH